MDYTLLLDIGFFWDRERATQTHVSNWTLDSFSVAFCGNKGLAMKSPPVKGIAS